jgi:hypothetical protein
MMERQSILDLPALRVFQLNLLPLASEEMKDIAGVFDRVDWLMIQTIFGDWLKVSEH